MPAEPRTVRLVCISDTHGLHGRMPQNLPEGDILLHAGDILGFGTLDETSQFNSWLETQPHPHKIVIAGNHDAVFQTCPELARERLTAATYLEDDEVTVCGLRFWGSPWTPRFMDWYFMLQPGEESAAWDRIPDEVDVLMTHGPPHRFHDEVADMWRPDRKLNVGCPVLRDTVQKRVQPPLHVFGHIHEGYGRKRLGQTLFLNASTCTERYEPTNPPIVIDMMWRDGGWHATLVE